MADKKKLLWFLIVISIIILIILWQIFSKLFPKKTKEDFLIKEMGQKATEIEKKFKELILFLLKNKFILSKDNFGNKEPPPFTNQKIEKLKTKVLEYLNKENQLNIQQ